jgi:eukaryotic-like serine/threonine-protein kinase
MQAIGSTYEGLLLADTYLVGRALAFGGMGAVHEASHVRLPKRFAVKFLDPSFRRNTQAYERFQREAEIASNLGHPHIAQVVDFNTLPDGAPYMVMELLEGEDLATRLMRGRLSIPEVLRLSAQLASGLSAAHKLGVVHRDLKPENVFLCTAEDGFNVKILDFGISKMRGAFKRLTGDTAVLGTPAYMSPEQARGDRRQIDQRTDVYAMGAVLYEALSGVPVYDGDDPFAILTKIATMKPAPLPGFPHEVDAVLQQALAFEPERRFGSVKQLDRALAFVLTGERAIATPSGGVPTLSDASIAAGTLERPRRVRTLLLVGAAIAVVSLALAVWLTRHARPSAPTLASATAASPAPTAAVPPPSTAAPPAAPAQVTITISPSPANAQLELDGAPVRSPLHLARSSEPHVLRARAPGHRDQRLDVHADQDQTVEVRLERIARTHAKPRAKAKPRLVGGAEL